jgi:hypothetical protein
MGDAQNSEQRGKPFAKGDPRINKGGRPKGYNAFRKAFRDVKDVAEIRRRLKELIFGGEASAAIAAAKLWLEYGYGKTPAAPEDNQALAESGKSWPLSREETIALAKGETE